MRVERINTILKAPIITEKASMATEKNRQFSFKVASDANKQEIKQAVEKLFNVAVEKVQVANVKGKTKRFGQIMGKRKSFKKAMVSLSEGHDIDFSKL